MLGWEKLHLPPSELLLLAGGARGHVVLVLRCRIIPRCHHSEVSVCHVSSKRKVDIGPLSTNPHSGEGLQGIGGTRHRL